jgi:hypothetical protein
MTALDRARAETYASKLRSGSTMFWSNEVRVYAGSIKQIRMPNVRTS